MILAKLVKGEIKDLSKYRISEANGKKAYGNIYFLIPDSSETAFLFLPRETEESRMK